MQEGRFMQTSEQIAEMELFSLVDFCHVQGKNEIEQIKTQTSGVPRITQIEEPKDNEQVRKL